MIGLEDSVGANYIYGQKVYTTKLDPPSYNIVNYIYENRDFFELLNYPDTLPGLLTEFPARITKIYKEQFYFETINHQEVNMDYFKRYTSYGFYSLILDWVQNNYRTPRDDFIQEVIDLTKTHIYAFKYKERER